jgi:ferredoxin-NADP reductase
MEARLVRTDHIASVGFEVDVEGPGGSFVLHRNAAKPAVFLAGGIGITPFRSIIKDATDRRLPNRIALLYSNRTAESTAFLTDLEAWRMANDNSHLQNSANAIYYLAGPPAFVRAMVAALAGLADPDDVRSEEFAGY